jgi:hypothetical protein
MFRARLARVALAAGLGLACGCSGWCSGPWWGGRCCPPCDCCDVIVSPGIEGPCLGCPPSAPPMTAPVPMAPPPNGGLTPQPAVPPLSTPPRLVPQPQQSQPMPYTP